jgi:LPS sulfotransferase NodH
VAFARRKRFKQWFIARNGMEIAEFAYNTLVAGDTLLVAEALTL